MGGGGKQLGTTPPGPTILLLSDHMTKKNSSLPSSPPSLRFPWSIFITPVPVGPHCSVLTCPVRRAPPHPHSQTCFSAGSDSHSVSRPVGDTCGTSRIHPLCTIYEYKSFVFLGQILFIFGSGRVGCGRPLPDPWIPLMDVIYLPSTRSGWRVLRATVYLLRLILFHRRGSFCNNRGYPGFCDEGWDTQGRIRNRFGKGRHEVLGREHSIAGPGLESGGIRPRESDLDPVEGAEKGLALGVTFRTCCQHGVASYRANSEIELFALNSLGRILMLIARLMLIHINIRDGHGIRQMGATLPRHPSGRTPLRGIRFVAGQA